MALASVPEGLGRVPRFSSVAEASADMGSSSDVVFGWFCVEVSWSARLRLVTERHNSLVTDTTLLLPKKEGEVSKYLCTYADAHFLSSHAQSRGMTPGGTRGHTMSWLFLELARPSEIQKKVQEELEVKAWNEKFQGWDPSYQDTSSSASSIEAAYH